ncbi:methyltransferase [Jannaschia pagri]|uniref:Methyltransferase n=1 Tax=Jannaschia pagri TaxID=2829797 RepID=A0ABQ4NM19_9RHOB|nr:MULTISPECIES: class I SAM-dependent methyltransferase [unclassified Jannaschia]GIT91613.1 methyltransferase [Jannaschia sp. AI_61]GIT95447.1 methyltransferase [Jannaschia sp. AI_62]
MAEPEVISLYDRHAGAFAAARRQDLFERPWLDAFRTRLPGPNVLDLGCGTGVPMAAYLIDAGCRVTGVDGAPAIIARASARFSEHTWHTADLRALPPLPPADGLLLWHSLFHLTDPAQRTLFAQLASLAKPGAPLLFTTGHTAGESYGTLEGQPLYHASLAPGTYRNLLRDAGFTLCDHRSEDPTCGGATVWLAQRDP